MNNHTPTKTADNTNAAPNVIIITRKRQIASFAALILPFPTLLGLLALLPLDKFTWKQPLRS
ncbi:hypothetical protein ACIQUF_07140 [Pseudomonas sp. NPDC090233]|uniref:hypothetical protein n=1 Tax=Pseudomonas sp. NPDC090233 TaxID=3364479 RepID=UPI00383B0B0C